VFLEQGEGLLPTSPSPSIPYRRIDRGTVVLLILKDSAVCLVAPAGTTRCNGTRMRRIQQDIHNTGNEYVGLLRFALLPIYTYCSCDFLAFGMIGILHGPPFPCSHMYIYTHPRHVFDLWLHISLPVAPGGSPGIGASRKPGHGIKVPESDGRLSRRWLQSGSLGRGGGRCRILGRRVGGGLTHNRLQGNHVGILGCGRRSVVERERKSNKVE
jgi:hypothetical protein